MFNSIFQTPTCIPPSLEISGPEKLPQNPDAMKKPGVSLKFQNRLKLLTNLEKTPGLKTNY
jgi:hypothetical protein